VHFKNQAVPFFGFNSKAAQVIADIGRLFCFIGDEYLRQPLRRDLFINRTLNYAGLLRLHKACKAKNKKYKRNGAFQKQNVLNAKAIECI